MYYSQFKQDQWLNENIFHDKKDGLFIDIGAHDGKSINNSLFFNELGWDGICFEPIPDVFRKLHENRMDCAVKRAAVWTETTTRKFLQIQGYSEMLSGFPDQFPEAHRARINQEVQQYNQTIKEIDVDCIDINEIIDWSVGKQKDKSLAEADILFLDTEGSEDAILRHLDYSKTNIKTIVFENNYDDDNIRQFLKSKGYEYLIRLEIDDIFRKIG